jgi:hypothetical protein
MKIKCCHHLEGYKNSVAVEEVFSVDFLLPKMWFQFGLDAGCYMVIMVMALHLLKHQRTQFLTEYCYACQCLYLMCNM